MTGVNGGLQKQMQKSKQMIEAIQAFEAWPKAYGKCLPEELLQELEKVQETCQSMDSQRHEKLLTKEGPRGITVHPDPENKQRLEELLRPTLDQWLEEKYEIDFAFHQNKFPYGIHTDSGYDENEKIYKQGIIPLCQTPATAKVYTVIFAEKIYHSTGFPLRDPADMHVTKYKDYPEKIEPDLLPVEAAELTQALAFEWQRGSLAIWDRAHLHCSSLFDKAGIESKTGLMWIARRTSACCASLAIANASS